MEINKEEKNICIGLTAHVDAGKTTLAEAILYQTGAVRKKGRVDHGNTFLDTFDMERKRGITIFSKQAVCRIGNMNVTLIDTPGHIDFSGELERSAAAMDMAVLVVSGSEGVDSHTVSLWRLLRRSKIPTVVFVNKMDMPGAQRENIMTGLTEKLSDRCVSYTDLFEGGSADMMETAALSDEKMMDEYIKTGGFSRRTVGRAFAYGRLFPCFFGSALLGHGIDSFLEAVEDLAQVCSHSRHEAEKSSDFSGTVMKIDRDEKGRRQTVVKINKGHLSVRGIFAGEKISGMYICSGARRVQTDQAFAGQLVHLAGPENTFAGQRAAADENGRDTFSGQWETEHIAEPVMMYDLITDRPCDPVVLYEKVRALQEEEPLLRAEINVRTGRVGVRLSGEVQKEVISHLMKSRYALDVTFAEGQVTYKETVRGRVEGIGHFEPLRHYAEVHILIEEAEPGSGVTVESAVSEEVMPVIWQKQALKYMAEIVHKGVLTGSDLTDVKMTLAAGRGHQKHTEGGDFKEAVCRGIRQGLRKADSVLLEPVYSFRMEIPLACTGRVLADMQRLGARFQAPDADGEVSRIEGRITVRKMYSYFEEFRLLTKGKGNVQFRPEGYEPCADEEEIVEQIGYDPDKDEENPCGSIFCAKGAGYYVPWDEVDQAAHIPPLTRERDAGKEETRGSCVGDAAENRRTGFDPDTYVYDPDFSYSGHPAPSLKRNAKPANPYGARKRKVSAPSGTGASGEPAVSPAKGGKVQSAKKRISKQSYLLVDGYNMIFAWDELAGLAKDDMGAARTKLLDMLADYQAFTGCTLLVVFDAYKVQGGEGSVSKWNNLYVIFTKEAETADQYIEKAVHVLVKNADVTVATSDRTEQVIIMGKGAGRFSASDMFEEIIRVRRLVRERISDERKARIADGKNYLFDHADEDLASDLERIRVGKNKTGLYKK